MAFGKGFRTVAAYKVAVAGTWGTPVACGALNGVEFENESISADTALIEDMQMSGQPTQFEGDPGNRIFNGPMLTAARYEGLEPLIASAFGIAGVPVQQGGVLAYKHTFKMHNSLEGIFGTLIFEKLPATKIHEYTTVKVAGFSFKHTQGQRAEITFRFIAHDLNDNGASGTNNTTTITTVTFPANRSFLGFGQLVARINDQAAGALGSTDIVYLSEFNLDLDNGLTNNDVTTKFGTKIDEPVRDGFAKITGSLVFSKYQDTNNNDALFAQQLTKARKKMDLVYIGGIIAGAENFNWKFFLPNLQFISGTPQVPGPGRIPLTLPFASYRVTAAPTGFTAGYTDPLTMEIESARQADALA